MCTKMRMQKNSEQVVGHAISLGVSRATTKLVVISTDDNGILENAVKEKKVKKMELVLDKRRAYDHVKNN